MGVWNDGSDSQDSVLDNSKNICREQRQEEMLTIKYKAVSEIILFSSKLKIVIFT